MSQLSDLHKAIEILRKEDVPTDDLEEKISQTEEEIMRN